MKDKTPNRKKENVSLCNEKKKRRKSPSFLSTVPYPVKALLIKYWFFGLNYFLFQRGLGYLFLELTKANSLYLRLISGFALGVFNDLLLYPILRVLEVSEGESFPYVFFTGKHVYSLLINVAYGRLIGFLSYLACLNLYNLIAASYPNTFFFREPFSYGLMAFLIDFAFLGLKNLCVYLIKGKNCL